MIHIKIFCGRDLRWLVYTKWPKSLSAKWFIDPTVYMADATLGCHLLRSLSIFPRIVTINLSANLSTMLNVHTCSQVEYICLPGGQIAKTGLPSLVETKISYRNNIEIRRYGFNINFSWRYNFVRCWNTGLELKYAALFSVKGTHIKIGSPFSFFNRTGHD